MDSASENAPNSLKFLSPFLKNETIDVRDAIEDDEDTWLYDPNHPKEKMEQNCNSNETMKVFSTRTYTRHKRFTEKMECDSPSSDPRSPGSVLLNDNDFDSSILNTEMSIVSVDRFLQNSLNNRTPKNSWRQDNMSAKSVLLRNIMKSKNLPEEESSSSATSTKIERSLTTIISSIRNSLVGNKQKKDLCEDKSNVPSLEEAMAELSVNEETKTKEPEEHQDALSETYDLLSPKSVNDSKTNFGATFGQSTPCHAVQNRQNVAVVKPFDDTSSSDESSDLVSKNGSSGELPKGKNLMNVSYVMISPKNQKLPNCDTTTRKHMMQRSLAQEDEFSRRKSEENILNSTYQKIDENRENSNSDSSIYVAANDYCSSITEIRNKAHLQEISLETQITDAQPKATGSSEELLSSGASLLSVSDEGTFSSESSTRNYSKSGKNLNCTISGLRQPSPLKRNMLPTVDRTNRPRNVTQVITNPKRNMMGTNSAPNLRNGTSTRIQTNTITRKPQLQRMPRAISVTRLPSSNLRDYTSSQPKVQSVNSTIVKDKEMMPPPASNVVYKAHVPVTQRTTHIPRPSTRIPAPRFNRPSSIPATSRKC